MGFSKKLIGSTTSTLILAVLREQARHGYEIVQRVNQLSEGALQWREGTVYPALHRLEKQGFIEGEWRQSDSGRQRRVYSLTADGHEELVREQQQWSEFSSKVNRVLEGCYAT